MVVDVSNSPSFEEKAALDFFTTATGNLLRYEQSAGVQHHVALSVVGTERLAQRRPSDGEKTIRGYYSGELDALEMVVLRQDEIGALEKIRQIRDDVLVRRA